MKKTLFSVLSAVCATVVMAEINYDSGKNTITIEGFPPDLPCTMKTMYMADKINAWDKVSYDKETDTYTVNANMVIGKTGGNDSCFRLGGTKNPGETLILNGDLTVSPFFIKGINPEATWRQAKSCVNSMIIGEKGNRDIRPVLKIGKAKTLNIGYVPDVGGVQVGGEMKVYNGTITAAVPGEENAFGGKFLRIYHAAKVDFQGAVISSFHGMLYDLGPQFASIENCTFSDGEGVIVGKCQIKNTAFKNLQTAVVDYGSLDAVFENCTFEDNGHNWQLRFGYGITCIDCSIGKAKTADIYLMGIYEGKKTYPRFASKRHVTVKVCDADGAPIAGAQINVNCEQQEKDVVENGVAVTGENGCTPGKDQEKAVLLTEMMKQATDTPNTPKTTEYSYTITAEVNGQKAVINNYKPERSWQNISITLK